MMKKEYFTHPTSLSTTVTIVDWIWDKHLKRHKRTEFKGIAKLHSEDKVVYSPTVGNIIGESKAKIKWLKAKKRANK